MLRYRLNIVSFVKSLLQFAAYTFLDVGVIWSYLCLL